MNSHSRVLVGVPTCIALVSPGDDDIVSCTALVVSRLLRPENRLLVVALNAYILAIFKHCISRAVWECALLVGVGGRGEPLIPLISWNRAIQWIRPQRFSSHRLLLMHL